MGVLLTKYTACRCTVLALEGRLSLRWVAAESTHHVGPLAVANGMIGFIPLGGGGGADGFAFCGDDTGVYFSVALPREDDYPSTTS